MEKNSFKDSVERINTTIGDLIEAVTQIALEAGKTEAEGYQLASLTLESILKKNRVPEEISILLN